MKKVESDLLGFQNLGGLVSILMPIKNAEPFLKACIESILDQTEQHWEMLAVDDNSTDESFSILSEYAKLDARIKSFRNDGKGIIDALRLAFSKSSGEFVTRMDADDKMMPAKLEILKRNLKSSGKGHLAVGQVEYFSEAPLGEGYLKYAEWLNRLTESGENFNEIYKECVIPSPCWMVHRADLIDCDAFNPSTYPEDYDLCFRFYQKQLNVIPCNEVMHLWRDHPTRSSRTDENYLDNRFLELKTDWFLKLDHDPSKRLALWGAGKKGKSIAEILIQKNISFDWVCNNPNKIGKEIYGVMMQSTDVLDDDTNRQLIIAVANPVEQEEIRNTLKHDAFWFC